MHNVPEKALSDYTSFDYALDRAVKAQAILHAVSIARDTQRVKDMQAARVQLTVFKNLVK